MGRKTSSPYPVFFSLKNLRERGLCGCKWKYVKVPYCLIVYLSKDCQCKRLLIVIWKILSFRGLWSGYPGRLRKIMWITINVNFLLVSKHCLSLMHMLCLMKFLLCIFFKILYQFYIFKEKISRRKQLSTIQTDKRWKGIFF